MTLWTSASSVQKVAAPPPLEFLGHREGSAYLRQQVSICDLSYVF
jgi:hypothetical protein